jgi:type IV pilus assembly protein PilY1
MQVLLFVCAAATSVVSGAAGAQAVPSPMNLSRTPLSLNAAVDPNVAVTLDDSGSMTAAFIPDAATANCGHRHPRFFSSVFNRLYYNPTVRYSPPLDPTGTPFPTANFNAAWYDGYENTAGGVPGDNRQGSRVVNLATEYFPQNTMNPNQNSTGGFVGARFGHEPRLRPLAPDMNVSTNLGTTDVWYTACATPVNASVPAPVPPVTGGGSVAIAGANAWLPFTSANNQTTGVQFRGTAGGTSSAFYYRFTGNPAVQADIDNPRLYVAVNVANEPADQQTNFANWYSYYRTRVLMARSAITRVFGVQDQGLRVVYQNLWQNQFAAGTNTYNRFSGAPRTNFFNLIYRSPAAGATPNRAAMLRAGELFRYGAGIADNTNPYWEGAPLSRELTCRQNFHVHVTDGYTNEAGNPGLNGTVLPVTLEANRTLPDGRNYNAASSQSRMFSNVLTPANPGCPNAATQCTPSLARIAFAYWATDLRPTLTNNVPPFIGTRVTGVTGPAQSVIDNPLDVPEIYWNPENDPASWQHMVNYTVGLGVAGVRAFPGDYAALRAGALAWPGLRNNQPEAVDDLWHAGLVSRGGYYSAADPQELVDSLSAALTSVVARRGTASAATVTSGVLQASALAFRTGYDSSDWSGRIFASTLDDQGFIEDPPVWEAGELLNLRGPDDRVIFTSETARGNGIPFRWDSLPADYRDALNDNPTTLTIDTDGLGEQRVLYVRGDRNLEINNGGPFRIRNGLLGAVINSGAIVVAGPSEAYTDEDFPGGPEQSAAETYTQFRANYKNRSRTIYVGANDGMLHAFEAGSGTTGFDANGDPVVDLGSGQERWAYIPREVAPNLSRLTNPTFEFTPFVDATPSIRDVFINGRWRTILVGSLRRGGQGVFALDVTEPNITEGDASSVVLWEFSDDVALPGATRMGYSYARPNIGRLANGRWVVLLSGGYNSEQLTASEPQAAPIDATGVKGGSTLFVLDAATGDVLRRFEFTPAQSRGLAAPTFGDYESDFIEDFAVAGDLQGNLWRFDLVDPDPSNWTVDRMYRPATDFVQPITSAPRLFPDTATGGLIAVVGTGKYLEPGDRSVVGVPAQALLGVRDYGQASTNYPIQPSQLQAQTLTKTAAVPPATATFRVTNASILDTQRGWRIALVDPGERAVTSAGALFSEGISIFSTIIPNGDDPCLPGLRGNLFILDGSSGGAPRIDLNEDGVIDNQDLTGSVGFEVADPPESGVPSGASAVGGGWLRLIDSRIKVPITVWRRRSWREISPDN